ncbi:DUF2034 domain-containing protein [Priestia megaterium]|uniref:DUF2034 domain-containing protein n=1 Tax=Priestia megaterium TaxID=1404 RepID=UPI002E22BD88|nr:DUF2034 domain-containing protein [Priestia megaterium]
MYIDPSLFKFFSGEYFEQLVMEVYWYMGYNVKKTITIGDQGVDLILTNEQEKIAVQCKRYKKKVNNRAIQEVFAGMHFYNCDKSIVVTSSEFTRGAIELAKSLNVSLVDCKALGDLLNSNNNYIGNNFYKNSHLTGILINAGYDLLENSRYPECIELLTKILDKERLFAEENITDKINAYNYLGLCYKRSNQLQKAVNIFKQGLEIGEYTVLLNNLAVSYRDEGDYIGAKQLLDRIKPDEEEFEFIEKHKKDLEKLIKLKSKKENKLISEDEYLCQENLIMSNYR